MRLHARQGDVARAQAVHAQLVQRLARLGAAPSAETVALARSLGAAAAAVPARALPVTLLRPPLLVGRSRELAGLAAAWSEGSAVLLLGEAGLGKSRLLAEFARGRRVVLAQGRPGDAEVPYATLARLLRAVLAQCTATLPPPRRSELARLLPEIGPESAPQRAGQPLLLQAAVEALLVGAERDGGPLDGVIVDDLHYADSASVEMLQAVTGVLHAQLRFAFAQRPGEGMAAVQALRDTLSEGALLTTITLAALDADALSALLTGLQIEALDVAPLVAALGRHTGGNPLFVLETLKQGWASGALQAGTLPQPATVAALIERRLARLSPKALALTRVAAIAGPDFDIALAEHAMGERAIALTDTWAELHDAQVLRESAFAHDLVYEAALRTVPPDIGQLMHGQCAAWLQAHAGEPGRIAEHWLRAGEPARAAEAFIAAARRAEITARVEEEAAFLLRAADAFDAAGRHEARFDALCDRMRVRRDLDFGQSGLEEARALLALARTDAQRLRAQQTYVGLLAERSQSAETVEAGRTAMALAERLGDRDSAVRLACHMATALCRLGRVDEALALLLPLRDWVDSQQAPVPKMLWHGDWAAALGWAGRIREAAAAYDTAIAAARQAQLQGAQSRLLMNCAVTLRHGGQLDRALLLARQTQALASIDHEDANQRLIGELIIARDETETGSYAGALGRLETILPKFEAADAAFWVQAARMVLAQLWLYLGQFGRAVPLLRDEPGGLPAWLRVDRCLLQRDLALATRQPVEDARVHDALATVASDAFRGPAMQVRALRGQPPGAVLAHAEALQATLTAHERFGVLMSLHTHVARAALAERQLELAVQSADAVLQLFDEGYAPDALYRAEALLVARQALLAGGRSGAAERALEMAAHWIRQKALPAVPTPFVDSFLRRNPVNVALLESGR
jgi:hypothetical protein